MRPVEEVDDQHVDGYVSALEFPGYFQNLVLVPVAEFALPESQSPFRHFRCVPCGVGVVAFDFGWLISRGHPVVKLP